MQESVKQDRERWANVDGFPLYSISDRGKLKNNKTGRLLVGCFDKDGYRIFVLCNNGKRACARLHRLVAQAFVPNIDKKPQVNHKDGNKENNSAYNLEWVTHQENQDHFWKYLDNEDSRKRRSISHKGKCILSENPNSKRVIRLEDGKIFNTIKEASLDSGIKYNHIGEVCRGKRKSAGGYCWRFYKEGKNARVC